MTGKGVSKPLVILAVGAAALAGVGGYAWQGSRRPPILEAFVFDTPGAPSLLLRTPQDKRVLVDGGSNADIVRRLTEILPFYSRRIDMLILTKPDAKHVTGLIEVLGRYRVDRVIVPGLTLTDLGLASSSDPAFGAFMDMLAAKRIVPEAAMGSDEAVLDGGAASERVVAQMLFPAPQQDFMYSKASGPQLLFRIAFGATSFVWCGNATQKIQKLIAAHAAGSADALIFSQSIAPANISGELMSALSPRILVYSKAVAKKPSRPRATAAAAPGKRQKADLLAGILVEDRFNIRERGGAKLASDGVRLTVSHLR